MRKALVLPIFVAVHCTLIQIPKRFISPRVAVIQLSGDGLPKISPEKRFSLIDRDPIEPLKKRGQGGEGSYDLLSGL